MDTEGVGLVKERPVPAGWSSCAAACAAAGRSPRPARRILSLRS